MSTKEIAIDLINQLPDHQVEKVIYILQGMQLADDPFYGAENMARVERAIADLEAGKGTEHELIEVD